MKTKLLIFSFLLASIAVMSQVVPNQVDDFQDGTEQNWIIGNPGSAVFPPVNVADAGPTGAGDNMLEYTSVVPPSPPNAGAKMLIFNASQWSGSYTAAGILSINMDVSVLTADLNLRIAFQGPAGTKICTTNAMPVVAGAGWTNISFNIQASDFTIVEVGGGSTIEAVLASVSTMRILSSVTPTWIPEEIDATLRLDNITASTTLSVDTVENQQEFSISPNPATSKLNVFLPNASENAIITVFDVLGKRVYNNELNTLSSTIDVSNWNSGVYLVRVSTDTATHTKRFLKQ
ncbi:hypothetical protein A9Q87_05030 [Flavobacteriales bacterium 34_180_T64]|nr:hypothetical protein A9Q87_05030 [Flavobacteriales bacterium 34_180_T64]